MENAALSVVSLGRSASQAIRKVEASCAFLRARLAIITTNISDLEDVVETGCGAVTKACSGRSQVNNISVAGEAVRSRGAGLAPSWARNAIVGA